MMEDIRCLLGIGEKKKTQYRCQYGCGRLTNGLTSWKGFICCTQCREILAKEKTNDS